VESGLRRERAENEVQAQGVNNGKSGERRELPKVLGRAKKKSGAFKCQRTLLVEG